VYGGERGRDHPSSLDPDRLVHSRHAPLPRALAAFAFFTASSVASAQMRTVSEHPSVLTYRTVRVAEGVYAFITSEERSSFQAGNSVAIIGDDGVLVFDTGNIPSATRRQIAEIRRLTTKPVRFVVDSHWHPDHTLGNAEYRKAFPGVTVIGTSATRDGILERVPTYVDQMRSFAPTDSVMRLRLTTGRMRDGSPMPDAVRLTWGLTTRDYAEFMPEVVHTTPSAPDLVFDDSLTITLGKRRVQLVRPGRGNTAGDTFLFLPDERVLLTGDLVTVPCPFPGTAYFADWIHALDALEARGAATKRTDFAPFLARFAGEDPVRREAFANFYAQPAVQRAYEEAKADVAPRSAP
jgi:cyclase